jgi:DHA1 family bicyclomycin/chloramphenicol resistance-like MFS transporter
LPETHPRERRTPFKVRVLVGNCWRVATGKAFFLLAIAAALAIASVFIYIGSAPAIILERWGLQETQFHYIFIPIVAGFMLSSFLSGRMAGIVDRGPQLQLGFGLLCFSAGFGALVHTLSADVPILVVQLLWFCMAIGAQLTYPVLSLEMIDMHPKTRGAAASVQSFIALGIGALVMGMVAPVLAGNLKLLAWISLVGGVVAWLAWRAGSRLRRAAAGQ